LHPFVGQITQGFSEPGPFFENNEVFPTQDTEFNIKYDEDDMDTSELLYIVESFPREPFSVRLHLTIAASCGVATHHRTRAYIKTASKESKVIFKPTFFCLNIRYG
jgi:hypothetical protein